MNNKFERLNPDEVASTSYVSFLSLPPTFKIEELFEAVKSYFSEKLSIKLFDKGGLEVEVLRLDAKGWRKGKIRFSVEFSPDEPDVEKTSVSNNLEISEPESLLDDIRQMMNGNS